MKKNLKIKAGYEYLLAYKLSVVIYDLTVEFCNLYLDPRSTKAMTLQFTRTHDQMVQAARSGMQNIAEGNKQKSLKSYIKLSGVARGSLEELLKDYQSFARQNKFEIWSREKSIEEIREIGVIWIIIKNNPTLPNSPNFPNLPINTTSTINLMITIINQANYLIDRLIIALKNKHMREGGLTEELFTRRIEYRKKF